MGNSFCNDGGYLKVNTIGCGGKTQWINSKPQYYWISPSDHMCEQFVHLTDADIIAKYNEYGKLTFMYGREDVTDLIEYIDKLEVVDRLPDNAKVITINKYIPCAMKWNEPEVRDRSTRRMSKVSPEQSIVDEGRELLDLLSSNKLQQSVKNIGQEFLNSLTPLANKLRQSVVDEGKEFLDLLLPANKA